jgi:hypothetical protein
MVSRAHNDVLRLPARYALKAMKILFPQMDLGTPELTNERRLQFIGDGETREADGSGFDSNITVGVLESGAELMLQVNHALGLGREDLVEGVSRFLIDSPVLVPSSTVEWSAALRASLGLLSGAAPTSTLACLLQCAVAVDTLSEMKGLTAQVALPMFSDDTYSKDTPSNWYGDDTLYGYDDDYQREYVNTVVEILRSAGQDYTLEKGAGMLRTFKGHRILVRQIWSSIDSERMVTDLIRNLGTAVRWLTMGPHPQAQRGWEMVTKLRVLNGIATPCEPIMLYREAERELMSTQKGREQYGDWLSDQIDKPYWEAISAVTTGSALRLLEPATFRTRSDGFNYIRRFVDRRYGITI